MRKIFKRLLVGSVFILVGLSGCATNPYRLTGYSPSNRLAIDKLDGVNVFGADVYLGKSAGYLGSKVIYDTADPLLDGISLSYNTFCRDKGGDAVDVKEYYLNKSFYKDFSQPSIYVNEYNHIIEPKMIRACKKKNDSGYSSLLLAWRGVGSRNNPYNGDLYRYNTVYYSIIENDNVKKYMDYMNEQYVTVIKPEEERAIKSRQIAEQERLQKEADKRAQEKREYKEKIERYTQQLAKLDKVKAYYPALSFFPGIAGKEVEKASELYMAAPLAFSQESPCIISSFAKTNLMINQTNTNDLRDISMIELQNINPNLTLNASEYARQHMTNMELMANQATLELLRNMHGITVQERYVGAGAMRQALVGMKLRCSATK